MLSKTYSYKIEFRVKANKINELKSKVLPIIRKENFNFYSCKYILHVTRYNLELMIGEMKTCKSLLDIPYLIHLESLFINHILRGSYFHHSFSTPWSRSVIKGK